MNFPHDHPLHQGYNQSGTVNPSLTYMALSARAAHHAADLLAAGGI